MSILFHTGRSPYSALVEKIAQNERVIGGSDAIPHSHPWIVSIQLISGSTKEHICGGAILSPTKIATTASCCSMHSKNVMRVMAGVHDLNLFEQSAQVAYISKMDIHPDYDPLDIFMIVALNKRKKIAFY